MIPILASRYRARPPVAPVDPDDPLLQRIDTTYSLPTGGTTHTPANSAALDTALANAVSGDVIVLTAGTTYTGNFKLRNHGGSSWIYIISSDLASLPAGTRVAPADASHMPTITHGGPTGYAMWTNFGASKWRICGVRFAAGAVDCNDCIRTGYGIDNGQTIWDSRAATSVGELPSDITFDRCIVVSTSDAHRLRHGIMLNGIRMSVVDCHISNCKDSADAMAIWTYMGDGPYKIINNFLEGTGENYLVGGTDPSVANSIPSDIEFRKNYLFKRLSWVGHATWNIKNIFELKNSERVLAEGNRLENNWADAQIGIAILFTPRNQSGASPWSRVRNVTFRKNVLQNSIGGFNIPAEDDLQSSQTTKNIILKDNVILGLTNDGGTNPFVMMSAIDEPTTNFVCEHNTFLCDPNDTTGTAIAVYLNSATVVVDGASVRHNIMHHGSYESNFVTSSPARAANWTFSGNVKIMISSNSRYAANKAAFGTSHPNDFMADGESEVGFKNTALTSLDHCRLLSSSPYYRAAPDGKDIGADIDAVIAAMAPGDVF